MPVCCDCGKDVPKVGFAKSQLKKAAEKRRCKGCAEPLAGESASNNANGNADGGSPQSCWICLCSDDDDYGPPRRDCSCRGTAGYVHMSCLVDMASNKSDSIDMSGSSVYVGVSVGGNVLNPWRECMTCRQVYSGDTIFELAKAMERKYEKDGAHKFWKIAAYDNLSGVLAARGDIAEAMGVMQKRLKLLRGEYLVELRSGTKRKDIQATKDLVNTLINIAGCLTQTKTAPPSDIKAIIDEAERYANEIRPTDNGRSFASVLRQHATLQHEIGDHDRAYCTMKKAMTLLKKDPSFMSSLNGIRSQWEFADMMMLANEDERFYESYELKEETLATAQRVLGKDHPYVLKISAELEEFRDRMGEEWISFGKTFRGGALVDNTSSDEVIATGFCYTGQRAKITGVTEEGYRALLSKTDGTWTVAYVPFPAVCLDEGTRIILHGFSGSSQRKRLNGKSGIVQGFEIEGRNFDSLRLVVDVDGIEGQMRVKPENAMPQSS